MRKEIQVNCGTVVADYNAWSGKIKIFLNGRQATKKGKRTYVVNNGEEDIEFYVDGNYFTGIKIRSTVLNESFVITERLSALDYIFAVLPMVFAVFFGAVGGFFGGLATATSLMVVPRTKPLWLKIILGIEFTLVGWLTAFLAAYLVGLMM